MGDLGFWKYRVVRKNGPLGIHEAYYDGPEMCTR